MKLTIRYKFVVGFLVIFCIGFTTMSFFLNKIIIKNNEKIIKKELLSFQKDLTIYLRQYLKLKQIKLEENNFKKNAGEIGTVLAVKFDDRAIIYSRKGEFLYDSAYENGEILIYEDIKNWDKDKQLHNKDLKLAVNNKSGYTIVTVNNKYIAVFSCPIFIDNMQLGIVRCTKDYSELFNSSKELLRVINISISLVFGVIFLFSVLLCTKITIPIIRLSKVSKEVAKGNFDVSVNTNSKDELGELADNFNKMRMQIKEQIGTIKKDRDNLKKIEKHRKAFFDNVTHEMKTPLTIISGYSQILLQQNFHDKEFFKKAVTGMNNESNRMHNMVLDLLEMSKVESNLDLDEIQEISISEIVTSTCEDMKIRADKYDIFIEKSIEKNVFVLGKQYELRQMMINLIDNSIKYGDIKSVIKIKLFKEKDYCNIIVEDKGQGIPADKIDKIFEPFYRVDKVSSREKGSNGLGLSIVKSIVEKHKGEIKLSSKENKGTKIYIKIPLIVYKMAISV
ncbi:sensor histidine kinase [Clostridium ganghwense]|uniref:histidine kinase n=1 Tax=Clostridium ganghwense TaxID=312089 RepID=A0ABT4CRG7_9CLOT|nr:HAMP domain-containing sensor histidine kinase [Clostridium ganghwense]MCY6371650.1 HAMP domain-containing sensor histidine kinase [Clostridium ganghwense]